MKRTVITRRSLIMIMLLTLSLAGCARGSNITFVSDDREFSARELPTMAAALPSPSYKDAPVTDAARLRKSALASLRADDETRPLADLLTRTLPADSRSVPYYAERATVNDRDAWVVVEVWGSAGGTLDKSRVWAFDAQTADVIIASVF